MSRARSEKERFEAVAEKWRRALSLAVLLLFTACALAILIVGRPAAAITNEIKAARQPVASGSKPAQDYSKFSHTSPGEHAQLANRYNCHYCHQRRDNSVEPRLPGHKQCINCHQTQFNTPGTPLCLICHTSEALNQQNPPPKEFPRTLVGFDAEYDHAQHMAGIAEARPPAGCAACHAPARRGIARTAPAGLAAHQTCFQCHTPGRESGGRDISSCGSCHAPGQRLVSVSTTARAYGLGFSHATHGPRQNLSCENCHTVGRRGLAVGRQVSSTIPAQHFPNTRAQSCATCHNDQRSFGENHFNNCKRCHTGPTFHL